ncbi:hypothetical protein CBL_06194 [Carabus blaptoides fortunei]
MNNYEVKECVGYYLIRDTGIERQVHKISVLGNTPVPAYSGRRWSVLAHVVATCRFATLTGVTWRGMQERTCGIPAHTVTDHYHETDNHPSCMLVQLFALGVDGILGAVVSVCEYAVGLVQAVPGTAWPVMTVMSDDVIPGEHQEAPAGLLHLLQFTVAMCGLPRRCILLPSAPAIFLI